ncbi:phage terminase small subunit [Pantoea sp. y20]
MALSPAQRHRARINASRALDRREALTCSPVSFHLQLNELKRDVERLRNLPATADRVDMKRDELLPRWLPSVETYLAGDRAFDNPVFAYCVVWLMDTGEMERALDWADIAIEQGQRTPENFKSTFPAFIADNVMEWAYNEAAAGHSIEPYFTRTFNNVRDKWRLHEDIKAKWFKFAGLYMLRDENGKPRATAVEDVQILDQADQLLAQAEKFNRNAGVKTMRDRITARIRFLTEQ